MVDGVTNFADLVEHFETKGGTGFVAAKYSGDPAVDAKLAEIGPDHPLPAVRTVPQRGQVPRHRRVLNRRCDLRQGLLVQYRYHSVLRQTPHGPAL